MTTHDDGGYAFPQPDDGIGNPIGNVWDGCGGMSMLDWFASKCDQPGVVEAYQLRGCPDVPVLHGWREEDLTMELRAMKWWGSLSLHEKYATYAELRYMAADAMLAERNRRRPR